MSSWMGGFPVGFVQWCGIPFEGMRCKTTLEPWRKMFAWPAQNRWTKSACTTSLLPKPWSLRYDAKSVHATALLRWPGEKQMIGASHTSIDVSFYEWLETAASWRKKKRRTLSLIYNNQFLPTLGKDRLSRSLFRNSILRRDIRPSQTKVYLRLCIIKLWKPRCHFAIVETCGQMESVASQRNERAFWLGVVFCLLIFNSVKMSTSLLMWHRFCLMWSPRFLLYSMVCPPFTLWSMNNL